MDKVYLDYNCFQRWFDDPYQVRIQLEALACQEIFSRAEQGKLLLIWSFMHQDETIVCPFPDRAYEAIRLSKLCTINIGPEDSIYGIAKDFLQKVAISPKDALHVACANKAQCTCFLTCDDRLLNQCSKLKLTFPAMNPVEYIIKVVQK